MQRPLREIGKDLRMLIGIAWERAPAVMSGYYLVTFVTAFTPLLLSFTMKWLIDALDVAAGGGMPTIPTILLVVLGARYAVELANYLLYFTLNTNYLEYLFHYRLQREFYLRFHRMVSLLDLQDLEDPEVQNMIERAQGTLSWRPTNALVNFGRMGSDVVTYVAAFIVLLPFGWWIPMVITVLAVPRVYLRMRYGEAQWWLYNTDAPQSRLALYLMRLLSEPAAIRETRILGAQDRLYSRLRDVQEGIIKRNVAELNRYAWRFAIPALYEIAVLFALAWHMLPSVLSGALSLGSFTLFVTLIDQLGATVGSAMSNLAYFYEHILYVGNIRRIFEIPPRLSVSAQPQSLPAATVPRVEFRDVSFRYPGTATDVLRGVSFAIDPGERLALVGSNGAGKSTIVKLLCRFYDVTDGAILADGVDLRDLDPANWRGFLGTLFQDFEKYQFTVAENIALGSAGPPDMKRVRDAAERSGAAEFIERLPKQYETQLGRQFDGEELSVGQWQKLAIARALYEAPPILILDEPTSAIDAESEQQIFESLERTYEGRSLLLVSHRFSTVRNADQILVIENGRITERGGHDELMRLNGKYARMFTAQAKGYV